MKRLLELLILLYPEDFRKQHEAGMRDVIAKRIDEGKGANILLSLGWDILRGMGVAHWRMLTMEPAMALASGGVLTWHTHARAAGVVFTCSWLVLLGVFIPVFFAGACVWNPHWGPVAPIVSLGVAFVCAKKGLEFMSAKLKAFNPDGAGGLNSHMTGMNIGLVLFAFLALVLAVLGFNEMKQVSDTLRMDIIIFRYLMMPKVGGWEGYQYLFFGWCTMMFSGFSAGVISAQDLGTSKFAKYKPTKWMIWGTILSGGVVCLAIAGWGAYMGGRLVVLPFFMAGAINLSAPLVARAKVKNLEGTSMLVSMLVPSAFILGMLSFSLVHLFSDEVRNPTVQMKQIESEFVFNRDEEQLWRGIDQLTAAMAYRSSKLMGTKIAAGMTQEQWCVLFHKGLADNQRRVCSKLENKNSWVSDHSQAQDVKKHWDSLPVVGDIFGSARSTEVKK